MTYYCDNVQKTQGMSPTGEKKFLYEDSMHPFFHFSEAREIKGRYVSIFCYLEMCVKSPARAYYVNLQFRERG